jgi:hypothetical protein
VGLGYLGLAYRNIFPVYGTIAIIAIAHMISWIAYWNPHHQRRDDSGSS